MKVKKITGLAVPLVAVGALALTACGSDAEGKSSGAPAASSNPATDSPAMGKPSGDLPQEKGEKGFVSYEIGEFSASCEFGTCNSKRMITLKNKSNGDRKIMLSWKGFDKNGVRVYEGTNFVDLSGGETAREELGASDMNKPDNKITKITLTEFKIKKDIK
ncbi:hypothetical protein ACIQU6_07445 [Streptomyces sp. NPDC090442]|uniref:hypothetical protein n=1 Tax=Streptomyces sp. NPDC090442 TaxID=3365962 RepID=UPI00380D36F2